MYEVHMVEFAPFHALRHARLARLPHTRHVPVPACRGAELYTVHQSIRFFNLHIIHTNP